MTMFTSQALTFLFLVVFRAHQLHAAPKMAGIYDIWIESIHECDDPGSDEVKFSTELTTTDNNLMTWNTNWTWPYDLDDKVSGSFTSTKWTPTGWSDKSYTKELKPFCDVVHKIAPEFFASLIGGMGLPLQCPVPAGNYELRDFPTNLHFSKFPVLEYGRYQVDVALSKDNSRIGCCRTVLNILPQDR
ncbi:uncharacterized protein [Anabrus simplex]|uniref:uncharacterized protein n=1 Tax=Anabrus simplex TaxID=316456 RepID=UPI0035A3611A